MSTYKAKHFHFIDDMDIAALALAAVERVESFADKIAAVLAQWQCRAVQRRALQAMSEHMLDDIGLTRGEVEREAAKHFWQR